MAPLIVNLAPTGMVPTPRDNESLPVTPDTIARDAAACRALGASIVHLHARDTDGVPTWRPDIFRDVIIAVRRAAPDLIVCVSTSGRTFGALEQRAAVLDLDDETRPDMASLTLGSMNFPTQASVNEPAMIEALATRMQERGIVPELEVFDLGMLDYARYLIDKGVLRPPFYVNLLLGSRGTLAATPLSLALMAHAVPAGATWAATGIGRFQFPVNAMAITMGGHVRVGLEDSLFMDAGKSIPASNVALVQRLVALGRAAGREPATPDEARAIIGLPPRTAGGT
ncbi:MAG: 3-keto-5-aminohexanoate cleavage protein [Acidobacteria bacterium]|nr:3-keto-5-aminohexanoate cleavage protein [Acidobacteriota bacterium]